MHIYIGKAVRTLGTAVRTSEEEAGLKGIRPRSRTIKTFLVSPLESPLSFTSVTRDPIPRPLSIFLTFLEISDDWSIKLLYYCYFRPSVATRDRRTNSC